MIVVRPAVKDDLIAFNFDKLPWRTRSIAGEKDGRLIGIGGLAYFADGLVLAWAELTDEARKAKVSLHKAALKLLSEARGARRIVAIADNNIEAADRWLQRLGFRPEQVKDTTVWVREWRD